MAGKSSYLEKAVLDWSLGGAAPTRPTIWGVGLSLGAPTSISGSEVGTGSGWTRQTVTMNAAASPAGSSSNSNAMTFGPALTAATMSGIQVWDTLAATVGNMLWYGVLATPRTLGVGDSLVIAAAALIITDS